MSKDEQTKCDRCKWAKSKTQARDVKACYCIHYGIIISHPKKNCRGFVHGEIPQQKDDN